MVAFPRNYAKSLYLHFNNGRAGRETNHCRQATCQASVLHLLNTHPRLAGTFQLRSPQTFLSLPWWGGEEESRREARWGVGAAPRAASPGTHGPTAEAASDLPAPRGPALLRRLDPLCWGPSPGRTSRRRMGDNWTRPAAPGPRAAGAHPTLRPAAPRRAAPAPRVTPAPPARPAPHGPERRWVHARLRSPSILPSSLGRGSAPAGFPRPCLALVLAPPASPHVFTFQRRKSAFRLRTRAGPHSCGDGGGGGRGSSKRRGGAATLSTPRPPRPFPPPPQPHFRDRPQERHRHCPLGLPLARRFPRPRPVT
nr:uncharacterized protein LOC104846455 [Loxodonta africana]